MKRIDSEIWAGDLSYKENEKMLHFDGLTVRVVDSKVEFITKNARIFLERKKNWVGNVGGYRVRVKQ